MNLVAKRALANVTFIQQLGCIEYGAYLCHTSTIV